MRTSAALYIIIGRHYGRHASFIANVFLQGEKPTTRLRNMLIHLEAGRQFTALSFRMPYEGFFVDGTAVKPSFLDQPDSRVEDHRLAD